MSDIVIERGPAFAGKDTTASVHDLSMILSPLGVAARQYADDTQAYVHGVASEAISLVEKMLLVSDVIGAWLSSNRLRLNPGKTQFIWVGGRVRVSCFPLLCGTWG